jgi:cytochrome P450
MSDVDGQPYWDPYDTEIDSDPYPVWRRLREEAPLYYNERFDFYALSRFDDVEAGLKDPARLSNAHGATLEQLGTITPGETMGQVIMTDPPAHGRLRQLISRGFTPRRISELEQSIRTLCADVLEEALANGSSFDYVQDFAAKVPVSVISRLIGVPEEDEDHLRDLVDRMFRIEGDAGMAHDDAMAAVREIHEYVSALLAARRKEPLDDLASVLVRSEEPGGAGEYEPLTPQETANFAYLLYSAGTETTARAIGTAAVVLAGHPDQRAIIADDPTLIPNAVEELLRYESPSKAVARWSLDSYTAHGVTIPKDSKVLLVVGSAGRDEREYPDADRFDVRRNIGHHVSFGYGIHFCVGAALARMELRVALEETLKRFRDWDVDFNASERLHSSVVRGWNRVAIHAL